MRGNAKFGNAYLFARREIGRGVLGTAPKQLSQGCKAPVMEVIGISIDKRQRPKLVRYAQKEEICESFVGNSIS